MNDLAHARFADFFLSVESGLAEVFLCLWLLLMGVNAQRWKELASAAAQAWSRDAVLVYGHASGADIADS